MKAIILAAGQGIRLKPFTDDRPKCLVEYRGRPLIDYALESLRACGIQDIVLVKGYKEETLLRPGVRYCLNPDFENTNMVHTLFCAEAEMNDDIIVSYGDIIYRPGIVKALIADSAEFSVVVDRRWLDLWQQRTEDPLSDAETLKLDEAGFITELGKKPEALSDIQAQYIGLFKISAAAVPRVKEFYHSLDKSRVYDGKPFRKMFMTSFIQEVIDRLMPVKAVCIQGGWLEVDCPSDLNCQAVSESN